MRVRCRTEVSIPLCKILGILTSAKAAHSTYSAVERERMTRILIVDDHHHYRVQLRNLLESEPEWEICGEAADGQEAVEKHSAIQPHVTVMDFNMPRLNGLDASRAILQRCPNAPILMLTVFASSQLTVQAKKHGIKGFCSKVQIDCIMEAIKALLRGEAYFPESFAASAGD
jgi:DNA-binding NarL/FixJ family response regulator